MHKVCGHVASLFGGSLWRTRLPNPLKPTVVVELPQIIRPASKTNHTEQP